MAIDIDELDWAVDEDVIGMMVSFIRRNKDPELGEAEMIYMDGMENGGRSVEDLTALFTEAERRIKES